MINEEKLSLDSPWALGEDVFQLIVSNLSKENTNHFVEFGSGFSSIRLGKEFKNAIISSLEHDQEYYIKTKKLLDIYKCTNVRLSFNPLIWHNFDLRMFWSYSNISNTKRIDAVLIDGPPYWTRRGREFCLYMVYDKINIGGKVFLDDASRSAEKMVLNNWLKTYPNSFEIEYFDTKKGLIVLTKIKQIQRRKLILSAIADNWSSNFRHIVSKLKNEKR